MVYVDYIMIYPNEKTVKVGEAFFLQYAVSPDNATCPCVRWSSTDPVVAAVNPITGYVYPKVEGTTTLIATACDGGGVRGYCNLTVEDPVFVTGITIQTPELDLQNLQTDTQITLTATVKPDNASNPSVYWESSNPSVAKVNYYTGVVTPLMNGSATIYAIANDGSGVRASCDLTVKNTVYIAGITLNKKAIELQKGDDAFLVPNISPINATNQTLAWTTSDPKVAIVEGGIVSAVGSGTAIITARAIDGSNTSAECAVSVIARVSHITVSPSSKNLEPGASANLSVSVFPQDAANKNVVWSSTDNAVVEVDRKTGKISAKSVGTANIIAVLDDGGHKHRSECKITVAQTKKVFIEKDGNFSKVTFSDTNKVWKCIHKDTILDPEYDGSRYGAQMYEERANFNLIEPQGDEIIITYKTYTDDEIKLLYAIDPHGVARYVRDYALYALGGDTAGIAHKDHIFTLLFNRKPETYSRSPGGQWLLTEDRGNYFTYLSESEICFGAHILLDLKTMLAVMTAIGHLLLCGLSFFGCKPIQYVHKIASMVLSFGEGFVKQEFDAKGSLVDKMLEETNEKWAYDMVTTYSTVLNDIDYIAEQFVDAKNLPNYNIEIMEYPSNKTKYAVYFKGKNGQTLKINDLHTAMKELSQS